MAQLRGPKKDEAGSEMGDDLGGFVDFVSIATGWSVELVHLHLHVIQPCH
jgi:hypothetical protein